MTHKPEEQLPHSLIVDLKHDVEALKKKLTQPDTKSHELILEIESMKEGIHQLNVIFEKALKEMREEDLSRIFHSLIEKVNTIANQNETIAKGMVALSDRIDELSGRQTMSNKPAMPVQHSMGSPTNMGRVAPRLDLSMPPADSGGFPSPPPTANRKNRVGLF